MESIKELKEIVQGDRIKTHEWYGRNISRKISIYITWILLHTNISANQVSILMIIVGWIACMFFAVGTILFFIFGAFTLQVFWLLDNADGEIAVYKKETSLTGIYLDVISHYLVHPLVMLCIGVGMYRSTYNFIYIYIGGIAGFSNLLLDLLQHAKSYVMFGNLLKYQNSTFSDNAKKNKGQGHAKLSILGWILKQYCLYPGVMNFITLAALIDFIYYVNGQHLSFSFLGLLLISYAIFYPISFLKTFTQMIIRRDIDKEYSYYFKNDEQSR